MGVLLFFVSENSSYIILQFAGSGIIDFSSLGFPEVMPSVFLGPCKDEEGIEDSTKSSDFHLQMGCIREKMDKIPANVKGTFVDLAKPTIETLSSIQQSSRALSLLSAQSHSMSSQSLETASMTLINNRSHVANADSNLGHALNHSTGFFKTIAQHGPQPGMYLMEADEEGLTTNNPTNGNVVGLHLPGDSISSTPSLRATDSYHPKGHGIVLNLLQLSSHLQRVEQQRHTTENEAG